LRQDSYTIDEARMSYAYKGSTIGNIDLSPVS
jgi:hypothetical protein